MAVDVLLQIVSLRHMTKRLDFCYGVRPAVNSILRLVDGDVNVRTVFGLLVMPLAVRVPVAVIFQAHSHPLCPLDPGPYAVSQVELGYTQNTTDRFVCQFMFYKRSLMPKVTLASLGPLVREKRGKRRLRDVAKEIGISAATLMRIESGRVPDLETFGKVCKWLKIDPGDFLGFDTQKRRVTDTTNASTDPAVQVSAHFRIDRLPLPDTASALARMLMFVAKREATGEFSDGDA